MRSNWVLRGAEGCSGVLKGAQLCVSLCLSVACLSVASAAPLAAEVIDRILAVVNGSVITLSDVHGAMRFGLVAPSAAADPVQQALAQLIERRLVLAEVERYGPAEPTPEKLDASVATVRTRFESAGDFEAALRETGLTAETLRRHVRDEFRVETYLQQRFAQMLQPSEEEILAYYRTHEKEFVRGGAVRPYPDVRGDARAALLAARRVDMIREWIEGLRRRADVTILPRG